MLDKKMTPPEQQQGDNSNPSKPSMPGQIAQTPQDNLVGDSAMSASTNQQNQPQDDQPTGDAQTDDTNALGAYPPIPPQVPPQDEGNIQDTQGSTAEVSQPTVIDTQNIDERKSPEKGTQDKQPVDENIQPDDKSPLPVGENAPLQDTSGGVAEGSNVDKSVKDMAKPVEPPPMEEPQVTTGQSESVQTQAQAVTGTDSSPVPQGTSSEQQPNTPVSMQSQTEGQSQGGPVDPSQASSDQASQSFQIPPASHTVGPTDQGQAQPVPPSQGGDTVPVAPLSQAQDDNSEEQTLKKAHEPVFILPDDYHTAMTIPIRVRVSSVPHPMDEDHYIQSIELFANGTSVGKIDLQPKENEVAEAEFQVNVQKGMVLRAVATCNKHGDWASEKTV